MMVLEYIHWTLLPPGQRFLVTLVCLSVSKQHYSKSYEWIMRKFYGGVRGNKMNMINFGGDLGLFR